LFLRGIDENDRGHRNRWDTEAARLRDLLQAPALVQRNHQRQPRLTDFDVFADAGGQYIAVQHTFTTTANSSGEVVVQFVAGVDNPIVNGIVVN
jgi:hypothetical protein